MKTETLAFAVNDIDEELIERAERPSKRRPRYLRYIAAAAAVLLAAGGAFRIFRLASRAESPAVPNDVMLPPQAEVSGGMISSDMLTGSECSLGELYEGSEAVAIVSIGKKLGESSGGVFLEATAEKLFKGKLPERLVLFLPVGSQSDTAPFPPFACGDRLLVGLLSASAAGCGDHYKPTGGEACFLYLAEASGEKYLLDAAGALSRRTSESLGAGRFTDHSEDRALVSRLINDLRRTDEAAADLLIKLDKLPFVYSLTELEAYFEQLREKNN